ncbi:type II toxin-antitoxin system VapC family toxin [Pyrococcus kukulkanii]|uniref:Type II toxin-antitoxin system VapC family toxin n=1 Tax=Pyrococcus kukulkanii TaxID=1609559 RepID=A0ABV4T639_9EURY
MKRLPQKIAFDPPSFIQITKKQNKELLEFILAEFEVYIPVPTLHAYLLAKAFKETELKKEIEELREVFHVIDINDDILEQLAELDAALIKEGIFMKFDDLLVGVSAIVTNSLLVVSMEPTKFYPLRKYGLDIIGFEKFLEEVSTLAREEAKKEKIPIS